MWLILYTLIAVPMFADGAKLPTNWITCKKLSERNECLKNAFEIAVKDLVKGTPSLGVLPLDPMRFQRLNLGGNLNGPVSIKLEFRDSDLIGMKHVTVKDFKSDWETTTIELAAPKIDIVGNYTVQGKVLVLPVIGDGKCKLSFDNFVTKVKLKLEKLTKNKKKYFKVVDLIFEFHTQKLTMKFDNLFNGNKALGDNFNVFINENWKEILDELKPSISKAYGEAFKDVANRIFSKIPADVLS